MNTILCSADHFLTQWILYLSRRNLLKHNKYSAYSAAPVLNSDVTVFPSESLHCFALWIDYYFVPLLLNTLPLHGPCLVQLCSAAPWKVQSIVYFDRLSLSFLRNHSTTSDSTLYELTGAVRRPVRIECIYIYIFFFFLQIYTQHSFLEALVSTQKRPA